MIINEEVKSIIEGSAFIVLVTINSDGTAHPIVAGKGTVSGDSVIFGIYKMEVTQKNLLANSNASVVAAVKSESGAKGVRLTGTAKAEDKQIIFAASKVEALL